MGNRALAHVEKVVSTYPIEGADNVEMAQVLDFHVLVKKGEFKVGDLAVYVEVDSVLPDHRPEFEFLRSKKFRVKAMKYNKFGIISQGILFPFASLGFVSVEEGQDVTQRLLWDLAVGRLTFSTFTIRAVDSWCDSSHH